MATAKPKKPNKWLHYVKPRLEEISEWKSRGDTDEKIAKKLGIGRRTLYDYKEKYPELVEAFRTGESQLDDNLESTFYNRALGMEYEETETWIEEVNGKVQKKKIKKTKKYLPPDPTLLIFSLKNRMPGKYVDKQQIDLTKQVVFIDTFPEDDEEEM